MKTEELKDKEIEETSEDYEDKKPRKVVVPGEILATGPNFLPGENTRREDKNIIATKYGLLESDERLMRVIPLSGIYLPRRGNVVIGKVTDITFNGWLMDINSPYSSFLPIMECKGFISKKDDLSQIYNYGDMIVAGVIAVKGKGVDLTTKEREFHKLEDGIIIAVNSNRVPRVIGKQGSMVHMIKEHTGCNIVVGQNGLIWIKGDTVEAELLAKEAINLITNNSFMDGLTDKVKEFLENAKKPKVSGMPKFNEDFEQNKKK